MNSNEHGEGQPSTLLSLKEIARRFASPLTEEHAWAVLHQLARRFSRQIDRNNFAGGSRGETNDHDLLVVLTLEGVSLSENGEVDVKEVKPVRSRQQQGSEGTYFIAN